MHLKLLVVGVLSIYFVKDVFSDRNDVTRQKRCIVVQKQSSAGGDKADDDYEDYRAAEDKKPDKTWETNSGTKKLGDLQGIPEPELLKYRILPTRQRIDKVRRLRNRSRQRKQ